MSSIGLGGMVFPPRVDPAGAYTADFVVPPPAAGALHFDCPSGFYCEVLIFTAGLLTNAVAGNRQMQVQFGEPGLAGSDVPVIGAPAFQGASILKNYTFAVDVSSLDPGSTANVTVQLPRLLWPPATAIVMLAFGSVVGDQFNGPGFLRLALYPTGAPAPLIRPLAAALAPAPLDFATLAP